MSLTRETTFVLASVAIHLIGGVALAVLHPRGEEKKNTRIIVDVRRREAPPAPAAPAIVRQPEPVAVQPPPSRRQPVQPPVRPTHPPVGPIAQPRPIAPPPVAPPPVNPPSPQPVTRPDLFNRRAIEMAMGQNGAPPLGVRDPGGTTRRAGDGKLAPGQRDGAADKEEAAARLHDMLGEVADGERVASGRVSPRLREAERSLNTIFHPHAELVTDEGTGSSFLKQWSASRPSGGTVARGEDDSRGGFLGGGTANATDTSGLPRTRTEVEVVIAADGSIVSAKVVARSGRRKFDAEALAAVKLALAKGSPVDEKTGVVTRWAVEAWVKVAPPTPSLGFSFDESSGKVGLNTPMKSSVQTHVALLSARATN